MIQYAFVESLKKGIFFCTEEFALMIRYDNHQIRSDFDIFGVTIHME
jgi:hypothetical protein